MLRLKTLAALAAFGAGTLATTPLAFAQPTPPVEAFAQLPRSEDVAISPDGTRIASIVSSEEAERVLLISALDGSSSPVAMRVGSEDAFQANWISNDYVTVLFRERMSSLGASRDVFWINVVKADGSATYSLSDMDMARRGRGVSIEAELADQPDSILLSVFQPVQNRSRAARSGAEASAYLAQSLFRYNMVTGRRERVDEGDVYTSDWLLDAQGEPVLREDFDYDDDEVTILRRDGRNWRELVTTGMADRERFGQRSFDEWYDGVINLVALSSDGQYAYYRNRIQRDRSAFGRMNVETGEHEFPFFEVEGADAGAVLTDWRTNAAIGFSATTDRRQVVYTEEPFAGLQRSLEASFPDADVVLRDWNVDLSRFIVRLTGGGFTDDYFLFEPEAGAFVQLARGYPDVPAEAIGETRTVEYESYDGETVMAYLTLPPGREPEGLPLVIHPHGGPQARDTYGFDHWTDFMANRGYAVLRPQFRGSDGFGRDWVVAGHGNWGEEMQDDLTAGVDYLVEQGIADADRVCIFGWSYGGYAALAGATITPDVYRCVIAGAPVSHIPEMMQFEENRRNYGALEYWRRNIGDWQVERDRIQRISPAMNAGAVQAPILLIHPEEDIVVPIEQSELMAEALQEAGRPYEFVRIPDDGHNLLRPRTRLETLQALEQFLMEHNPPD